MIEGMRGILSDLFEKEAASVAMTASFSWVLDAPPNLGLTTATAYVIIMA